MDYPTPTPTASQEAIISVSAGTNNFVCPGFQRIAEEIKSQKASLVKTNDEDDDLDEVTYDEARPPKLFKLTNVLRDDADVCENGKETENVAQPEKLMISQQEFRQEVLKMLKKFFKYAFTIIIDMRRLCPEDAFGTTRAFGVEVPRFLHPSALEYVDEVARKLVIMMNRNTSEGGILHIMIEKNKTLHVVQRFVFKTMGTLEFMKKIGDDDEEDEALDLNDIKARCRASLLQLLNSDEIKPMIAPQYSRWSISVGITSEFAASAGFSELWDTDPNNNHFPWKVKPRRLANMRKTTDDKKPAVEEVKLESTSIPAPSNVESVVQLQLQPETIVSKDDHENSDVTSHDDNESTKLDVCDNQSTESVVSGNSNQTQAQGSATHSHSVKLVDEGNGNKIICFPISSFSITSNLMLSIYGLEYPAPIKKFYNSSVLSPKIGRSPSSSYRERLIHIRNRLLRQSGQRPRT